jgi:hypothetical protein
MTAAGITSVTGTPGSDVIRGTDGDDVINGAGGDDVICGLGGADRLLGGDGDDLLIGGGGNDRINGQAGADVAKGGFGNDRVLGGFGNDEVLGGGGSDELRGGSGDDVLRGANADDLLIGGGGADALGGGKGPDDLRGGAGNDVLHGGKGIDDLSGGGGGDLLFSSEQNSKDTMDGGKGDDAVAVGKRGTEATGISGFVSEKQALSFQGSYRLSTFSTDHACCENRVVNIQLMADAIHGHVVMPGQEFSINDVVGRRTRAKGYLPAGAIIGGYVQCCDSSTNIGGGTSQFATTFYNAIFYAGLEDIEHRPHSIWFSRYPEGIEATMGYPSPDVVFRNDTTHPLVISTEHAGYDGTEITVKFWGDNEGRQVTARKSGRYNYGSLWVIYEPNPSMDPGDEVILSSGSAPYSINVFRDILYADGTETTEKWTVRYNSPRVIETHPCNIPGSGVSCYPPGGGGGGGGGGDPGGPSPL